MASLLPCRPRPDHYFPDLHHLKFEIEEGTMLDGRPVRFGYSLLEFPDFSWRGYAQMSPIQVSLTSYTAFCYVENVISVTFCAVKTCRCLWPLLFSVMNTDILMLDISLWQNHLLTQTVQPLKRFNQFFVFCIQFQQLSKEKCGHSKETYYANFTFFILFCCHLILHSSIFFKQIFAIRNLAFF